MKVGKIIFLSHMESNGYLREEELYKMPAPKGGSIAQL